MLVLNKVQCCVSRIAVTVVIIPGFIALATCGHNNGRAAGGAGEGNRSSTNEAKNMTPDRKTNESTDIDALARLITLPVRPVEATWRQEILGKHETSVPGPTDYRLTAVLKFDATDVPKLIEKSGKSPGEASRGSIEIEPWFPEEVKGVAHTRDDETVVEGDRYSPDLFLRSPYSGGKLIRVGQSNYFVLRILSF